MRHPLSLWENSQTLTPKARNCSLLRCCLIFLPCSCGPLSIGSSRQAWLCLSSSHTKLPNASIRAPQELFCLLSISDTEGCRRSWEVRCHLPFLQEALRCSWGHLDGVGEIPTLPSLGQRCAMVLLAPAPCLQRPFHHRFTRSLVFFCLSYKGDVHPPLCQSWGYMSPLSGM